MAALLSDDAQSSTQCHASVKPGIAACQTMQRLRDAELSERLLSMHRSGALSPKQRLEIVKKYETRIAARAGSKTSLTPSSDLLAQEILEYYDRNEGSRISDIAASKSRRKSRVFRDPEATLEKFKASAKAGWESVPEEERRDRTRSGLAKASSARRLSDDAMGQELLKRHESSLLTAKERLDIVSKYKDRLARRQRCGTSSTFVPGILDKLAESLLTAYDSNPNLRKADLKASRASKASTNEAEASS